jgi:type IV pilus assembly protein PilO
MEGQEIFEKIESIKMPVRISILAGAIVLLLAVFIALIYLPKTEKIKTVKSSIEELDKQLVLAQKQREKLAETQKEKEEKEAQFQAALKLLPDKKEIPSLLTKVSELGKASELDFRVFTPKKEAEKEFYVEIPVSIEVSGTYHNVAVFFDRVGQMERIMNIQNVSMKPIKEDSKVISVTCDATTYSFKGTK